MSERPMPTDGPWETTADGAVGHQPAPPPAPAAYRVLAVCSGNICRSPALERLWAAGFGPLSGVEVGSAGTDAVVGSPIDPPVAQLIEATGAPTSGFAARQLTADMVRSADLVIGFTRSHRAAAVKLAPPAVRRSFTFLELARMLEQVDRDEVDRHVGLLATPGQRLAEAVALAQRYRSPAANPKDDDVQDPYGSSPTVTQRVFDQILTRSEPFFAAAFR